MIFWNSVNNIPTDFLTPCSISNLILALEEKLVRISNSKMLNLFYNDEGKNVGIMGSSSSMAWPVGVIGKFGRLQAEKRDFLGIAEEQLQSQFKASFSLSLTSGWDVTQTSFVWY